MKSGIATYRPLSGTPKALLSGLRVVGHTDPASSMPQPSANPFGDFVDIVELLQEAERKHAGAALFEIKLEFLREIDQLTGIFEIGRVVLLQNILALFSIRRTKVAGNARNHVPRARHLRMRVRLSRRQKTTDQRCRSSFQQRPANKITTLAKLEV